MCWKKVELEKKKKKETNARGKGGKADLVRGGVVREECAKGFHIFQIIVFFRGDLAVAVVRLV
jgi:hypothetical protein